MLSASAMWPAHQLLIEHTSGLHHFAKFGEVKSTGMYTIVASQSGISSYGPAPRVPGFKHHFEQLAVLNGFDVTLCSVAFKATIQLLTTMGVRATIERQHDVDSPASFKLSGGWLRTNRREAKSFTKRACETINDHRLSALPNSRCSAGGCGRNHAA